MAPEIEDHQPADAGPSTEGLAPPGPVDPRGPEPTPEPSPVVEPEIEPNEAEPGAVVFPPEALEPGPEPAPAAPEPQAFAELALGLHESIDRVEAELGRRLAALQAQFDREVRAEANRERIVDRLHAELQEYKQDLLLKVLRPVFIDLIQLHDDVGKSAQLYPDDAPPVAPAVVRDALESIRTAVEDVLYRQGVEPFRNEGTTFDPRRQRAVTTTPTDDEALAKTIASRVRPGFQSGEKVVRPEVVTVYTYKKPG